MEIEKCRLIEDSFPNSAQINLHASKYQHCMVAPYIKIYNR